MNDWNRILSATLAVLWLGLCALGRGATGVLSGALTILVPLACIWFPEELGNLTTTLPSPLSTMPVTHGSPGCAVRFFGWIALLALTVVRLAIVLAMSR